MNKRRFIQALAVILILALAPIATSVASSRRTIDVIY